MSHVSRPLLGVLIATVVGFAVWTVALKKSVTGSGSGGGATSTNTLQSAVDKAHQAVTTSDKASVAHGGTVATTPTQTITTATTTAAAPATKPAPASGHATTPQTAAQREAVVVRAINAHKVVAILFFNKAATDDQAVKAELATIPTYKGHVVKLAVPVSELVQYPVITTQVPITGSPTLVLIDPSAHVTTIVGFSDRFEIGRRVAADLGHAGSCSVASYSAGCVRHYSAAEKAYLAKVRKVCANFSPAPIKTGPMTRAAAMAYYSGVLAIIGKLQTSVGAIPGPDPLHAQMAGALATERQTVRLIDSAMAAMKNGDVARARSLVAQAKAVEAPADAVFRGVGLGICVGG